MKILIASKNKGKIKEIKDFFTACATRDLLKRINLITFEDIASFPDIEEGSDGFIENALLKAKTVAEFTGTASLADDSGLAVDALDGRPGVISSRYAGPDASDYDNRKKLIEEMRIYTDTSVRTARFICEMVLWDPFKGVLNISEGICEGKIGFTEKGNGGFGYDPVFLPEGSEMTMAEISSDEKNMLSHRGKALFKLLYFLNAYLNENT